MCVLLIEFLGFFVEKFNLCYPFCFFLRTLSREQGREEAMAYLRNANGDAPVTMGVTSVAPPAAVEYNEYNPNFPNYHYQVPVM